MSSRSAGLGAALFVLGSLAACGGTAFTEGSGGAPSTSTSSGPTSSHTTTVGAGGASSSDTSSEVSASSATTGAGGAGGAGGASASSSSTTSSTTTGGGPCDACQEGTTCCNGVCRNTNNDILNCGGCNIACLGTNPFCNNGVCSEVPCNGIACFTGFCCGSNCCDDGQLCCDVPGPGPSTGPTCINPADYGGTCPVGCTNCN